VGIEQCDDGNNRNGDGCSANCMIEKEVVQEYIQEVKQQATSLKISPVDNVSQDAILDLINDKIISKQEHLSPIKDLPSPITLPTIIPQT